jgi:hypothetical protein
VPSQVRFLSHPAPQRHKARRISYGGVTADVDEKIAGLVLAMWRAEIRTRESCEYVGGVAEIGLSRNDLEAFRRRIGPAAGLVSVEFHGSTADPFALHRMRFRLADVPALCLALRSPAVRADAAV